MRSKRIWRSVTLVFGIVLSLIGAALIIAYVMEAIVGRAGDPDQSLLFWYLPILFLGIIGLGTGLSLVVWATNHIRKIKINMPEP